jgi:hypothetical protein
MVAGYSGPLPLISILAVLLDYAIGSFRASVFPIVVPRSCRLSLCPMIPQLFRKLVLSWRLYAFVVP